MLQSSSSLPGQPAIVFTPRQGAVLEAALKLLVEGGERALTTAGVARAANCSKESLYKWFGDREGLLAAMITFQASKVRATIEADAPIDSAAFREHLVTFGRDLLSVLAGEVSLALNRLAIGQAGNERSRLGALLLVRGRRMIGIRGSDLLEVGRRAGLIDFDDREEAFRTLYGLIVGDRHVRLLLGEAIAETDQDFEMAARRAVGQFWQLYGAGAPAGSP